MDPNKPEELTKDKLNRYQNALDYLNDVRFAKFSPPESKQQISHTPPETTYIPGTKIAEINKDITEGNTASSKALIKTWLEIDPANSLLTSLLEKTSVSPQDLLEAAESVLSRYTQLQYARNNLSLAEAKERENAIQQPQAEKANDDEEADRDSSDGPVQQQEEQQAHEQQSRGEESGSSGQSSGSQSLPPVILPPRQLTNKERFGTKENYAAYKEANKESRDEKARKLWENRKKAGMDKDSYGRYKEESQEDRKKRAKDLWDRRKAGLLRGKGATSGFNPLGDWLGKKIAEKIAQSRIGQAVARNIIDPLKQAITNSRAWQAVAPRLQPIANALDKIASPFRAVSNALGAPERWLNSQMGNLANWAGRGLQNIGAQAIRGISNQIGNLFNAARPIAGQIGAGAAATGAGIYSAGGTVAAVVTSAAFVTTFIVVVIAALFLWSLWSIFQSQDAGCDKPGEMKVQKVLANPGSGTEQVRNGQKIDYLIQVTYNWACAAKTIENVVVTDTLPQGLVYDQTNPTAESEIGSSGPGPKGAYNETTRTLTWTIPRLLSNDPASLYFSVTPNETLNDSWVMNSATVSYTDVSSGTIPTGGGFPPTQDNCGGTYQLTNPLGNFGDPKCDFKKDDLYKLLKQVDPKNADFWFYQVVRCESGYNPNSWRDPNISPKTPDPAGAWGLYQMGRGRNGQYDHGDVEWQLQTTNAVTYAQGVSSIASYWACAR